MGNAMSKDGDKPTDTANDKDAFAEAAGAVPFVGPLLALTMRLSGEGRKGVATLVLLLIIYPVLAFTLVLFILRFSPSFMQDGARNFVLSSLGVEDSVRNAISQNNKVIDFARSVNFDGSTSTRTPTKQNLRIGQRVMMRTDISWNEIETLNREHPCFGYRFPKKLRKYGSVFVSLEENSIGQDYEVRTSKGHLGEISAKTWEKIARKNISEDMDEHVMVEWTWSPSKELLEADPNDCASVDVSLGITVFKS